MGTVADDWEAAQVWLRAVARKSGNGSAATVNTYGYHLAKLRWYCENVLRITPSRWSMQEVEAFYAFLEDLPEDAICAASELGRPQPGQAGYTPFRKRPARSSQADIRRFVHALFKAWHSMGYIRINPMALTGSLAGRKIETEWSLSADVFEIVLDVLAAEDVKTFTERQRQLRDRFVLLAFKELGLRAGELVGASMGAFYQLYDPASKKRYWIFLVTADTGKAARERRVPVTRSLLASLTAYRESFGLVGLPIHGDTTALLLSPRTRAMYIGSNAIRHANDRGFSGPGRLWEPGRGCTKLSKIDLAAPQQP